MQGETKAEMRASLWKLPIEDADDELTDDGTVKCLEKLTDLGSDENGDMK